MDREIKFRAWDEKEQKMYYNVFLSPILITDEILIDDEINYIYSLDKEKKQYIILSDNSILMQFTGLKDKNGNTYIYEGDIINIKGVVIGNKYENEDLLKDEINLLIEGICTKNWCETYKKAMERGCKNA